MKFKIGQKVKVVNDYSFSIYRNKVGIIIPIVYEAAYTKEHYKVEFSDLLGSIRTSIFHYRDLELVEQKMNLNKLSEMDEDSLRSLILAAKKEIETRFGHKNIGRRVQFIFGREVHVGEITKFHGKNYSVEVKQAGSPTLVFFPQPDELEFLDEPQ